MRRRVPGILIFLVTPLVLASGRPAPAVPHAAADSLSTIGDSLFLDNRAEAILNLVPAYIRRAESSRDSVLLGRAIAQRGRALLALGRRDEAEKDLDTGIRIAESVRDTTGLMPALGSKGFAYVVSSKYEEGLRCFERQLLLAQHMHSTFDEASARSAMGYALHLLDRQQESRQEYLRAISLFHAEGRTRFEISPLIGLGRTESALGNIAKSIQCYKRAWVAAHRVGDRVDEMWAVNNLSVVSTGDPSINAQYTRRAYALSRELKNPQSMVIPATNLAGMMIDMGDLESAENILTETRAFYVAHGGGSFMGMLDLSLGQLRVEQGKNEEAIALLRPLIARPGMMEPQDLGQVAGVMARALAATDSTDAAIELLTNYVAPGAKRLYGLGLPGVYLQLAQLHGDARHPADALAWTERAREAAERTGNRPVAVRALLEESIFRNASGDAGTAARTLYAALDSMEAFRGVITMPEWRENYGQGIATGIVDAAAVLLDEPASQTSAARIEAFFNAVQRMKARTLLDRITEPRLNTPMDEHPWSKQVATLRDLQAVLQSGEVMLDFCVGAQSSFLVAVTADSARVVRLPGPESPLSDRIRLLRALVSTNDAALRAQYPPARLAIMQHALAADLLGPALETVMQAQRVLVSADGFLAAVPFGILIPRAGGNVLMSDHDIVQVSSASVLVLERKREAECTGGARIVAVASSSGKLKGARDEVRDLAHHYRNVRVIPGISGVDGLTTGDCDVMHIAAHATVVDRSPWQSGFFFSDTTSARESTRTEESHAGADFLSMKDSLAVAKAFRPDPYLRAWQIARIKLGAQLAVLSGCETAGGRVTTGEGTLGLTAAFLSAGVPAVVSSLWPIDDRATREMMRSFYRHLADREPIATALRHAQLEISRSAKYAHPYYWAGFVVVGDGSRVVDIERRSNSTPLIAGASVLLVASAIMIRRRRRVPKVG